MKKGDKIIWDSHFGYEIGYFIEESNDNMCKVNIGTGIATGECLHSKNEIHPYNLDKLSEMQNKYNYTKEFSEYF